MKGKTDMKRGFSLIEVLIATAIFLVIILGMLGVFERGYMSFSKIKFKIPAYNIARQYMEQYYDWDSLDDLDGTHNGIVTNGTYALTAVALPIFSSANTTFASSLNITNGTITGGINGTILKRVKITVNWGSTGNFSITSLKANY